MESSNQKLKNSVHKSIHVDASLKNFQSAKHLNVDLQDQMYDDKSVQKGSAIIVTNWTDEDILVEANKEGEMNSRGQRIIERSKSVDMFDGQTLPDQKMRKKKRLKGHSSVTIMKLGSNEDEDRKTPDHNLP